ncbi:MAG: peptidoglycan DD-metalloendopeptidase family protein [Patescibacteria group bacterium]
MKAKPAFIAILALVLISPFFASGSKIDDLKNSITEKNSQIAELEKEIAGFQKEIEKTAGYADNLKNQIKIINATISKLSGDISLTRRKIEAAELTLEKLNAEIGEKELSITELKISLTELIRNIYEMGNQSVIEILLAKASLSNFFSDMDDIESLSSEIDAKLSELKEIKAELESEMALREDQRKKLLEFKNELSDRKSIEEAARSEKNTVFKLTKNKEAEYQKLLKEREIQREAALNEIQEIEDELRKLIDPESLPEARRGLLAWPISGATLTQDFGVTPYSKILYDGKPHNGIDIRAQVGTPVYAAEDGVIAASGNTDAFPRCLSYGKWILIKHPNNLATLYAHLSLIKVANGNEVKRGDLIGYSGDTGYAKGPHLHFTVYAADTVEFKSSSLPKSTCKFLPFGGYLNPLSYL